MATLPYQSSLSWAITETHTENLFEMKTGSYTMEVTYGINPLDTDYNVVWNLPASSKTALVSAYRSNPVAIYDFTPPNESTIKVRISNLTVDPIRINGSYHRVTGTLKRRYE